MSQANSRASAIHYEDAAISTDIRSIVWLKQTKYMSKYS